jgi:adenylosuccinate lyase
MQGTVTDRLPTAPSALDALSAVDGRYADKCAPLRALMSEAALIRHRVRIEAEWFSFLARGLALPELSALPPAVLARAEALARAASPGEAEAVKAEEKRIAHDVKAVEYHLRAVLGAAGASAAQLEFVHFACTSEDINNLAYALMLKSARDDVLLPAVARLHAWLIEHAHRHAGLAMLSRTHGQPATPTTLGKELANVARRLARAREAFAAVPVLGKLNGAVGNWNAHAIAYPDVDWRAASRRFVTSLGLVWNEYTVQIEPHDWIAEYCDALARLDTVLIDFARDAWGYVALGYFRQGVVAGEVGSSTMPHKVNPIDFENGEGNLGLANALLRHFADKLPVSRWQRDLSDSTVLRNLGVALAHALLAFLSIERGLGRLEPDPARLAADLNDNWEVLGEALQTVMRRYGVPNAYERLKSLTRGRRIDAAALAQFIATLPLPAAERERLARLTPADYIGLARELADDA